MLLGKYKKKAKKDRAETKKNIFMTGGGKPPSPSPSNLRIIDSILGPALEGISNIYDSDALIDETNDCTLIDGASADDGHDIVYVIEEEAPEVTAKDNKENLVVLNDNKMEIITECIANTSKNILKESNETNKWNTWTPKLLKTPVSSELKVATDKEDKESWLKRRRPRNNENCNDILTQEKIQLVKILQENALKEGEIRVAILKEQLKQEKIKTEKLESS